MPTPNALDKATRDRFLADCAKLADIGSGDRIGIAVSGGPDSMALLLLAAETFPGRVAAATVDHRLRAESANEAGFVADVCAKQNVPHATLSLSSPVRGNISAYARVKRYAALDEWAAQSGIRWLVTAHHADDQLETMIMRLNRGSGLAGLSGVRARNGNVLRPLLGWKRIELAAIVEAAGLEPIDDPSNRDDRYDRAKLRKALKTADWLDPLSIARSAAALAEAEEALTWSSDYWAGERIVAEAGTLSFRREGLPAALVRRIVEHCLRKLSPGADYGGPQVTRLLEALGQGAKATLGGVACDARGALWTFELAPPRARVR